MAGYWESRKHLAYYRVVQRLLDDLGPLASLLDVGCWDTPAATWGDADERFSVDMRPRPELPGVRAIVGRWPDCASDVSLCDVVLCLQVLEHLDDPRAFCRPLFAAARRAVIVSVPWGWPALSEPSHRQDPVDGEKLERWTGRRPALVEIVRDGPPRAVLLYDV